MRGQSPRILLCISFLICAAQKHMPRYLLGASTAKKPLIVESDSPVKITIFGNNLPENNDYYFTRFGCQESEKNSEKRVRAEVVAHDAHRKAVTLQVTLPEVDTSNADGDEYSICYNGRAMSSNYSEPTTIHRKSARSMSLSTIIIILTCLILLSAVFSGLNFAFMCLSINDLELIRSHGDPMEKTYARNIIWFRRRGNWLICTFAACNVVCNSLLTNIFGQLLPTEWSIIADAAVPAAVIVVFGELLPQAICYRRGLAVASMTRFITFICLVVMAPFAWPLSKLVDFILGREVLEVYSEKELKGLLEKKAEGLPGSEIISRVFDLPKKTAGRIMTPIADVFLLSTLDVLEKNTICTIIEKGYTRIPVYYKDNLSDIRYVLNVKDLIPVSVHDRNTVQELMQTLEADGKNSKRMAVRFITEEMKAHHLMFEMVRGEHHLCVVVRYTKRNYRIIGLVTLEDVVEELFGEIEDDSDKSWANRRTKLHRDQSILDWFRTHPGPGELPHNAQLLMIQALLKECPQLIDLQFTVPMAHQLLNPHNLMVCETEASGLFFKKGDVMRYIFVVCSGVVIEGHKKARKAPTVIGAELVEELYNCSIRGDMTVEKSSLLTAVCKKSVAIKKGGNIYKFKPSDIVVLLAETEKKRIQREYVYVAEPGTNSRKSFLSAQESPEFVNNVKFKKWTGKTSPEVSWIGSKKSEVVDGSEPSRRWLAGEALKKVRIEQGLWTKPHSADSSPTQSSKKLKKKPNSKKPSPQHTKRNRKGREGAAASDEKEKLLVDVTAASQQKAPTPLLTPTTHSAQHPPTATTKKTTPAPKTNKTMTLGEKTTMESKEGKNLQSPDNTVTGKSNQWAVPKEMKEKLEQSAQTALRKPGDGKEKHEISAQTALRKAADGNKREDSAAKIKTKHEKARDAKEGSPLMPDVTMNASQMQDSKGAAEENTQKQ